MGLDPISSIADLAKDAVDRFFPDKGQEEKDKMAQMVQEAQAQIAEAQAQIATNDTEAKSGSLFVSGARPFCIWVGGAALAYASVVQPCASFVAKTCFHYQGDFPVIDSTVLGQVLFGLLGLGGMRSWDKKNGTASK